MSDLQIQTRHPDPSKTNKKISKAKYELIKAALLEILSKGPLTHLQLMEAIHQKVHKTFEGSPHWYGETVKLDLEARKVIKRTKDKTVLYQLTGKK